MSSRNCGVGQDGKEVGEPTCNSSSLLSMLVELTRGKENSKNDTTTQVDWAQHSEGLADTSWLRNSHPTLPLSLAGPSALSIWERTFEWELLPFSQRVSQNKNENLHFKAGCGQPQQKLEADAVSINSGKSNSRSEIRQEKLSKRKSMHRPMRSKKSGLPAEILGPVLLNIFKFFPQG